MGAKISWRSPLRPRRGRLLTGQNPFAGEGEATRSNSAGAEGASVAESQRPRCFREVLHRDPRDEAGLAKRRGDLLPRLRQRRPGFDPDSERGGASLSPARSEFAVSAPFWLSGPLEGWGRSTGRGDEGPWGCHRRWPARPPGWESLLLLQRPLWQLCSDPLGSHPRNPHILNVPSMSCKGTAMAGIEIARATLVILALVMVFAALTKF